jgi:Fe-S cluster biosynthesis and repair protein YggX
MNLEERIAQFENMAQADPENEMAHFSLGGAYAEAGRPGDAAASYENAIKAQPDLSKAYQLAAENHIKAGDDAKAVELLTRGYGIAAANGDLMPKNAMAKLLEQLGAPVPTVANEKAVEIPEGAFVCQRTGRPGTQMERPPFKGPVGEWIRQNVSKQTFDEWLAQGTKVINELRLDLSRDEDAATYDQYMHEYLGIDEALLAQLTSEQRA